MPFGLFWNFQRNPGKGRPPIIIVTEALCRPLLYFRLRANLTWAGFPVYVFEAGNPLRGLREKARRFAAMLEHENIRNGIIIGHGGGSLAGLALPDAARQRIQHLIALGTPFHGSRLYLYLQFIPALRDLAVGSEYLLLNRLNALLFPSFTPFCAWQDECIIPFNLAYFGQGRDLIFDEPGHFNLVLGYENISTIVDFLKEKYPLPVPVALAAPKTAHRAEPAPALPSPVKKIPPGKKRSSGTGKKSGPTKPGKKKKASSGRNKRKRR